MEANVRRGYLEVHDEKGSYRIPLGRRSRRCLMVLDRKEGEYVRFLEIDLFTGFVYYSVDNETSGGLSYYYDMSSKKVGHYFIHRYLLSVRNCMAKILFPICQRTKRKTWQAAHIA